MKGATKYILILIISLCAICVCIYRYQTINENVPNLYEKQAYRINEDINLDDITVNAESFDITPNEDYEDNYNINIKLKLKNNSSKVIDGTVFIDNSKLTDGFICANHALIDGDNIKEIEPGKEIQFTMHYVKGTPFNPYDEMNIYHGLCLYLPNNLYKNQIEEKYNDGKLYAKYIQLN